MSYRDVQGSGFKESLLVVSWELLVIFGELQRGNYLDF